MPGEIWAVVVAAGAGDRLAADRPKAFVRLGGRTMLAWSLAMLDDHDLIDGIVMVVPEEYEERASLLADDLCATKIAAAVPGGATRPESVAAGVACVPDGAEFVLVHDAARPLTPPEVVDRVVAALRGGADGVVPALAMADTVKRVGPDGSVAETLERGALRAVQTPQGFPAPILREALAAHTRDATDCASMVEALGRSRRLRRGRRARVQGHDARPTWPAPSNWPATRRRGTLTVLGVSADGDGQPQDVVLADGLDAGHVVLADLRGELVDAGLGERHLRARSHASDHRGRERALHAHPHADGSGARS